jgi:hypothetical protein
MTDLTGEAIGLRVSILTAASCPSFTAVWSPSMLSCNVELEEKNSRRVVAQVEWHPGELYRFGRIVANLARVGLVRSGCLQLTARRSPGPKRERARLSGSSGHAARSPPTPSHSASSGGRQPRQLRWDAGDARDGGTVAPISCPRSRLRSVPRSSAMASTLHSK